MTFWEFLRLCNSYLVDEKQVKMRDADVKERIYSKYADKAG